MDEAGTTTIRSGYPHRVFELCQWETSTHIGGQLYVQLKLGEGPATGRNFQDTDMLPPTRSTDFSSAATSATGAAGAAAIDTLQVLTLSWSVMSYMTP
jgi:hypothetical protein